jgi:hypothetical protein
MKPTASSMSGVSITILKKGDRFIFRMTNHVHLLLAPGDSIAELGR